MSEKLISFAITYTCTCTCRYLSRAMSATNLYDIIFNCQPRLSITPSNTTCMCFLDCACSIYLNIGKVIKCSYSENQVWRIFDKLYPRANPSASWDRLHTSFALEKASFINLIVIVLHETVWLLKAYSVPYMYITLYVRVHQKSINFHLGGVIWKNKNIKLASNFIIDNKSWFFYD